MGSCRNEEENTMTVSLHSVHQCGIQSHYGYCSKDCRYLSNRRSHSCTTDLSNHLPQAQFVDWHHENPCDKSAYRTEQAIHR